MRGEDRRVAAPEPRDLVVALPSVGRGLRGDLLGEKNLVDLVVGPDEYRRVPELVENALAGDQGIAVKLSRVETYDDIIPLRTEGIAAWVSIMRGCDKFCTFCVVPCNVPLAMLKWCDFSD